MATVNQEIDFDTAYLVAGEFGITAEKKLRLQKRIYYLMNLKMMKRSRSKASNCCCNGTRRSW